MPKIKPTYDKSTIVSPKRGLPAMALLQTLYHLVVKYGLVKRLIRILPVLSLALALIGSGWLFALPMDGQYRRTYISENALMPSQAYSYFRESEWNVLRGFRTQVEQFEPQNITENMELMKTWLEDIGYKTSIHETSEGKKNLYAILHSPKGDDTESMVLGAGYFNADNEFNIGGVSLALALARYFHRWLIWSKNIIIVIPQDPNQSLREWVNAYHNALDLTGGSIESAVMMDYPSASDNFEYVEMFYEGLNGQLPNLDMVNTFVHVCEHEGPRVSIQGTKEDDLTANDYWSRLRILFHGIKELSIAGLKKGHGNEAFSGYRIQAITLKVRGTTGPYDITVFGRIPEAVFRSINNLLEKFHQSFFFYLLLAPRSFVSIGTYLPSAGAFVVAFILSSLHKILNSEFEIRHLTKFTVSAFLIFAAQIFVGFIIMQVSLLLPTSINYGLIGASVLASLAPLGLKLNRQREFKPLLRAIALLYFSTVLSSLLVLNFSLTLTLGIFALPLTFINDSFPVIVNCLCLLISNPFILLVPLSFNFDGGLKELLTGLISSWKLLNCHTWVIITIGWFPTWLTICYSVFVHDSSRSGADPKKSE
jgi:glycosylphosphatidylinositol transamidase